MLNINAILLAGGQSSRFGSDKALVSFAGMKLIEYIYNSLDQNFKNVIVVGSKDEYSFLKGAEIREDIYQNKGPLAGIYTGLYFSKSSYNFICGCDMPFLNSHYFNFLKEEIRKYPKKEIIVPKYNNHLEPLAAVYQRSLITKIKDEILADNLKIKSFYSKSTKEIINEKSLNRNFDLEKLFFNLNYPKDLTKALKHLKEVDKIE